MKHPKQELSGGPLAAFFLAAGSAWADKAVVRMAVQAWIDPDARIDFADLALELADRQVKCKSRQAKQDRAQTDG